MNDEHAFNIVLLDWEAAAERAGPIREQVFVHEQNVPLHLEWDGLDGECIHALALLADGTAIGTARLRPNGHVGRMAVLPPWRGRGAGSALLCALTRSGRERGIGSLYLHAQVHAIEFYRRHHFSPVGPEFLEAGIAHRKMVRSAAAGDVDD